MQGVTSFLYGFHRQYDAQDKDILLCLECTDAVVAFGDGANALAAVAVPGLIGQRDTVFHGDVVNVRIPNFDEQFVLFALAIYIYIAKWLFQIGCGIQSVFNAVREQGAQVCIGNRQFFWHFCLDIELNLQLLRFAEKGAAQQIDNLVFAESKSSAALRNVLKRQVVWRSDCHFRSSEVNDSSSSTWSSQIAIYIKSPPYTQITP